MLHSANSTPSYYISTAAHYTRGAFEILLTQLSLQILAFLILLVSEFPPGI